MWGGRAWPTSASGISISAMGRCRRSNCGRPSTRSARGGSSSRTCPARGGRSRFTRGSRRSWRGWPRGRKEPAGATFKRLNDTLWAHLTDPDIRLLLVDTDPDISAMLAPVLPEGAHAALAAHPSRPSGSSASSPTTRRAVPGCKWSGDGEHGGAGAACSPAHRRRSTRVRPPLPLRRAFPTRMVVAIAVLRSCGFLPILLASLVELAWSCPGGILLGGQLGPERRGWPASAVATRARDAPPMRGGRQN
jgi:hypothetical protein